MSKETKYTSSRWGIKDPEEMTTDDIIIMDEDGINIAIMDCDWSLIDEETRQAVMTDARLIAAAPEMFQALEKIRHFLQWHVKETGKPHAPATILDDYIAETLAKAKGE